MNTKLSTASFALLTLLSAGTRAFAQEAETVSFAGPAGVTLTGVLYTPADYDNSAALPAVVMLHGCTGIWSNREVGATNANGTPNLQNHIEKWGLKLASEGYVALAVDSYTPREPATLDKTKMDERKAWQNQCSGQTNAGKVDPYTTRVLDARAAYAYLTGTAHEDHVDADRIGLLGWSQGAESAMIEAADATRDVRTPLRAESDLLFATTVVYYPGCGSALKFGSITTGWWRPYSDFRMQVAENDTLRASCVSRYNRATSLYSGVTGAPDLELGDYVGADHSFDAASETWPTATCAAPSSGDVCAMNDADINSFDFFESHL